MTRPVYLAFVCGLALGACAGLPATLTASPVAVDAEVAAEHISALRARHGLGPVRPDGQLMRAAASQAIAMASRDRLSHSVSWRSGLPRRLSAAGYRWGAAAENIGSGYRTLHEALAGWERSAPHRNNLLMAGVSEIGIAAAYAPGSEQGYFWTLILAGAPPQPQPGAWGAPM